MSSLPAFTWWISCFLIYSLPSVKSQAILAGGGGATLAQMSSGSGSNTQSQPNVKLLPVPAPGATNLAPTLNANRFDTITAQGANRPIGSTAVGSLSGLAAVNPVVTVAPPADEKLLVVAVKVTTPAPLTTTIPGYLVGSPYPFVLPPPDIPYFGSKWNGPWGYPIGHYQAFRGTGQYITHYNYYPLSYFGSLMAPFAFGMSGK